VVTRRALTVAALEAALALERRIKARPDNATLELLQDVLPEAKRRYRAIVARANTGAEKINLAGLPRRLRLLITELVERLGENFRALTENNLTLAEWERLVRRALVEYHLAAWMVGAESETIPQVVWGRLVREVNAQLEYLRQFRLEIQTEAAFQVGWQERAQMYAESIKVPYWRGHTKVLPLPAMPAQGTQCLTNCACRWEIKKVDEKRGDYDCYWRLEPGKEHCQTCLERSEQWNPLRIRGGVLQ